MKKLIIQIPCLNEEQTLPAVLSALPRQVPGIDRVEWLVVNDGSTDRTTVVARAGGADHVLELTHVGLARAFMAGLDESLRLGADIIVNLDGDNQYSAADIPKLVAPLLEGRADIAVGARPIDHIRHFSASKKFFQKVGSWVVRKVSGTSIVDCTSGFRAISRRAALELHVLNSYTYTLETIIQAGQKNIPAVSVPIRTNPYTRPSRLMKSTAGYIGRSIAVIFSIGMTYQPLRFFLRLGALPLAAGFFLAVRWLVIHFSGSPKTHVPSLVVAAILTLSGFQIWVFGLIAGKH
jgi:glycosyltransferase involved in cell wall biosynthesis